MFHHCHPLLAVNGNKISTGILAKLMQDRPLKTALDAVREIEITVTGRRSGRRISLPVWFVNEGDNLLLLPLRGKATNWYRNILKTPAVQVSFKGTKFTSKSSPVTTPAQIKNVVEKFRTRYGAADVKKYYSNYDAIVELKLPGSAGTSKA